MEEAFGLSEYLPLSFKAETEEEYVSFLWNAFETNCQHGGYQFAFLAYHLLSMAFIYFNLWQIRRTEPKDFANSLIGFSSDIEYKLLEAGSPFTFSIVRESSIMRFLKLIGCDNANIGTYVKLVKDRNNAAHPNGHIYYNDQHALEVKVREVLRVVAEIQAKSRPIIERCYEKFLLENHDPEVREYSDAADQICEILIHGNYLSAKDLEICAKFDVACLASHDNFEGIQALHGTLAAMYEDLTD